MSILLDFRTPEAKTLLNQHGIALTVEEARTLQKQLDRPITLMEATMLGIQLSEHCSYKSSRPFLKHLPTKGDAVYLGPGEDAGIVKIFEHEGEQYCVAIGHESHNHPSQIVPYEGAATGIGGIVRDILCMGARPCAVLDSLRLGDPTKVPQANIARGVVDGIAGYGNPLGVPNMGGDVYFDEEFDQNCLVNVTAMGSLRGSDLIHSHVPKDAAEENWELIIVGKPTDNSGFGGASFASGSFEKGDDLEAKKAAVQEPNPFLERHLVASFLDLYQKLKNQGKYHQMVVKDLGAGGVMCATVELADGAGFGAEINLDALHTVGDSPPHVLVCSETQERFAIACHPSLTQEIIKHFVDIWDLGKIAKNAGATRVGVVTKDNRYVVRCEGEEFCNVPAPLLTQGIVYDRNWERTHVPEKTVTAALEGDEVMFSKT